MLEHDVVGHSEPSEQAEVLGEAAQEDVLAVVQPEAVALDRERRAAESRARLEQRDLRAAVRELEGGRDPGQPAADDRRLQAAAPMRLRAATQPFSQAGSDTRRSSTDSGSRSIRPRSRRYMPAMAATLVALGRSR
jgi:hypothetical protein